MGSQNPTNIAIRSNAYSILRSIWNFSREANNSPIISPMGRGSCKPDTKTSLSQNEPSMRYITSFKKYIESTSLSWVFFFVLAITYILPQENRLHLRRFSVQLS